MKRPAELVERDESAAGVARAAGPPAADPARRADAARHRRAQLRRDGRGARLDRRQRPRDPVPRDDRATQAARKRKGGGVMTTPRIPKANCSTSWSSTTRSNGCVLVLSNGPSARTPHWRCCWSCARRSTSAPTPFETRDEHEPSSRLLHARSPDTAPPAPPPLGSDSCRRRTGARLHRGRGRLSGVAERAAVPAASADLRARHNLEQRQGHRGLARRRSAAGSSRG